MAAVDIKLPEVWSSLPGDRLYRGLVEHVDAIIPQVKKEVLNVDIAVEDLEGFAVKTINYYEDGQHKSILYMVEFADKASMSYKYSVLGGTGFPYNVEKISYHTKLVEGMSDTGCTAQITMTYKMRTGDPLSFDELENGKSEGMGLFKAVEGFLLKHPEF